MKRELYMKRDLQKRLMYMKKKPAHVRSDLNVNSSAFQRIGSEDCSAGAAS